MMVGVMVGAGLTIAAAHADAQAKFGQVNVGSSATATVTLTVPGGVTLGSVSVVTQGAVGLDFNDTGTGSCAAGMTGQTCTVEVSFAPLYPGVRHGAAQLKDGAGHVIATGYLAGVGVGPEIAFDPGTAFAIDPTVNGLALNGPFGLTVDAAGNLFIADGDYERIVKVPAGGGVATAVSPAPNGRGLENPGGVVVDAAGNLFISDLDGDVLIEVPADGSAPVSSDPIVNGVGLKYPCGMVFDGAGNLYVADVDNARVLEFPVGGGTPVVVNATVNGVPLSYPVTVAMDGADDLFISDEFNNQVVEVPAGGGAPTAIDPTVNGQSLYQPYGIAVDAAGDLFIADLNNRVVEVPAGGGAAKAIAPVVNGKGLNDPIGIALDGAGDLFIADWRQGRVIEVPRSTPPALNFAETNTGTVSSDSPQTVEVENIGNAPLTLEAPATGNNPAITANFTLDSSGTSACPLVASGAAQGATLSAGTSCQLQISFDPAITGSVFGTLTLTDNTLNAGSAPYATQAIALSGDAPVATMSLASVAFSEQQVGTTSTAQKLTLTNTGSAALGITNIAVTGANATAFSFPNTCAASLAVGANCVLQGTFTPTGPGANLASLMIADNANGAQQTVALAGAGIYLPSVTVNPSQTNITTAQALTVTTSVGSVIGYATPTGTVAVNIAAYAILPATLSNGSAMVSVPAGSLAVGTHAISVTYTPDNASATVYGVATGANSVVVTAAVSATAPAATTGAASSATASAVTVAGTANPNGADTQVWFLYGTSNTLSGASQTAAQDIGATTANDAVSANIGSLSPNTTYYFQLIAKNSVGTTSGSISSFTTTASPTFTMSAGNGVSVAPGALSGNTSTVSLTPMYGFTGAVNLSCAISPAAANDPATCSVPGSVTISGTAAQSVTVTVYTTAASAMSRPANLIWPAAGGGVLACVLLWWVPKRRRGWLVMLGLLALFVALGATACSGGGGGGGGGQSNPGTTAGNYTVTVTGVSGSTTTTATVALTVQ